MEDLIFRNRNKSYGAYHLRRRYPAVMAFSISVTIACAVAGMIYFHFQKKTTKSIDHEMWYFFDMGSPEGLKNPLKRERPPAAGGAITPCLIPNVVDSVYETDTLINPDNGEGSDTTGLGSGTGPGNGDGPVYGSVQVPPSFPGGEKERNRFIQQNIIYPPQALKKKISGTVYISFIVEKNGILSNIKLLKGIGFGCDEEALRVTLSMPAWAPGKQNGNPVRVHMVIPITFVAN